MNDPTYPSAGSEANSPESVRQALAVAQRRLAYSERFSSLIEQQMQALSEQVAAIARETSQEQERQALQLEELRREAETLRKECQRRQEVIDAVSVRANREIDEILAHARQTSASLIASTALRLQSLAKELQGDAMPDIKKDQATSNETRIEYSKPLAEMAPEPIASVAESVSTHPLSGNLELTVTRLTVRPPLTGDRHSSFQRTLQAMPGVRRVNSIQAGGEASQFEVAHAVESSLLGNLLATDGLDFQIVARTLGALEIQIL